MVRQESEQFMAHMLHAPGTATAALDHAGGQHHPDGAQTQVE